MELAISAVTGELVSRFITFLTNRYSCHACSDEKRLERLQQLLLRARTVIEEADGRYITNSGMLAQLKMLADAMYRGYWAMGAFKYRSLKETPMADEEEEEVSSSSSRLKRSRIIHGGARKHKERHLMEFHAALESLEIAVANITEFVVILSGCDRMVRRPYDTYLYTDNFVFGRHSEKQMILSFLLQHSPAAAAPAVLPIIGGLAVGKKTLVAHVCKDERVCSHFSSIIRLNETELCKIADRGSIMSGTGRILIVVEIFSDVDEKDWTTFYSYVATMAGGSKVIILSRLDKMKKFGTVNPIFLNALTYEEFSYLFKALAFGSANPVEHPQLVQIADRFARELQSRWSILAANLFADVMRTNPNVHFWLSILSRCRRLVDRNLTMFGEHPKLRLEKGLPIDVTDMVLRPASPLQFIWNSSNNVPAKELPQVTFTEMLVDLRPKMQATVVRFESRIPPYTTFDHILSSYAQDTPLPGTKRRGVP
ncbi:hypothetical protein D1007_36851 [Hordeum vulgare]|nr:hypothetical protein D1007_36851 [Hordeum vulgare]